MSQIEVVSTTKKKKLDAFLRFCGDLRNPLFTENNYIIASVNVVCYENNCTLQQLSGEVLLITHGYGIGNIRISEGDVNLFNERIYNLLESADSEYSIGRTAATLVIETPMLPKFGIHRIDLMEDVKQILDY